MTGNNSKPSAPVPQRRRSTLPLIIVAALFIIVPFLTWYGTWFGRTLSDEDVGKYLTDEKNPRHVQHALLQIADRLDDKDASVKRWYPQIIALAASPIPEFRLTVAWLMGKDNDSQEFHAALQKLLEDSEPNVRRNAALSLVTFRDGRGRTQLRAMLQPYTVAAPMEGTIISTLPEGTAIKMGGLLARIKLGNGGTEEVRSPLSGKINGVVAREGVKVAAGDIILSIAPDSDSVWEALRALYLIGEREDLPLVERYAQGVEEMPERVKQQAALTAKAIQSRSSSSEQKESLPSGP
jgi:biotin carboxyl carrier protein